jgi:serine/threonine protein kinase
MEPLQPGDTLDTFRIDRVLFSGAMALIYKASDVLTDETVALKVPLGDILNNPIQYYHYQNEERIGRTLDHPNIVGFLYRNRSRQYIIEEYVDGKDLRSMAGNGRKMEFSRASPLVLQIAEALTYLHDRGIIHLDLKPENILITPENQVKILDFGLAFKKGLPDLLAEDFFLPHGTPYYIAPEQLVGHRREKRSDLYSLGILFYEMLTGSLPFPRSTKLSTTRRRLKNDAVPPRYHDPSITPQVQEIILKCLERQPENRYSSAAELADDLLNHENLPINTRGLNRKKPCNLFAFLKPNPSFRETFEAEHRLTAHKKFHILGAVLDDDNSNFVVEEIRRLALIQDAEVTLLSVIEEQDDSHFRKYGLAVEGERFRSRLERYIQRFRRYNIDPTIRLIPGGAADTIVSLANKTGTDLIVLGPSRTSGSRIFGESTIKKVTTRFSGKVLIARSVSDDPTLFVQEIPFDQLTEEQVLTIDLLLVDSWFHHVNWLANLAHNLLQGQHRISELDPNCCVVGKWLAGLKNNSYWRSVTELIIPIHEDVHAVAEKMASYASSGDMKGMLRVYKDEALSLSCGFRQQFIRTSELIRERSGHHQVKQVPLLHDKACPIFSNEIPYGGPLLKLHGIRHYLNNRSPEKKNKTPPLPKSGKGDKPGKVG